MILVLSSLVKLLSFFVAFNDSEYVRLYDSSSYQLDPGFSAQEFSDLFPITKTDLVVDVGCGTGWSIDFLLHFNPSKILGLDNSEEMLSYARKKFNGNPKVELKLADASSLVDLISEVDLAFCCRSLSHMGNLPEIFRNIHSALRKGGSFVFFEEISKRDGTTSGEVFLNLVDTLLQKYTGRGIVYRPTLDCEKARSQKDYLDALLTSGFTLRSFSDSPADAGDPNPQFVHILKSMNGELYQRLGISGYLSFLYELRRESAYIAKTGVPPSYFGRFAAQK